MAIQSSITALMSKSPGSVVLDTNRIRSSGTVAPMDAANALTSLQQQVDAVVRALATSPTITQFEVTGPDGSLIAWIGDNNTGGVSYQGAWFKQLYIGGTSAATAKIVADSSGNVTINGASIVLNSGGVTTTLNNITTGLGTVSLQSLDNAGGYWAGLVPFGLYACDNTGTALAYLLSGGGSGHLLLQNVGATKVISAITSGGGSPRISVTGPGGTTLMSDASVDSPAYYAGGVAGVTGSATIGISVTKADSLFVNSVSSATGSFGSSLSVSTASNAVFGTPATGQSNGTVVTSVSLNVDTAVTSVSPGFATALTDVTLNTVTHAWTKGLMTT